MGIFNRLFRAHTKVDGAELCRYRLRHGLITGESGIELQLKYVVMNRNLPIIIPLWALKNMEAFKDAKGNFSLEMVKGCNVLFQIEASSEYRTKKGQIEEMKKRGVVEGKVVDARELLRKREEERKKALKKEKAQRRKGAA